MIKAVFFDVGETLVDQTREWACWANWLGVPQLTLFSLLGAAIERGGDIRHVLEIVRPGITHVELRAQRYAAGLPYRITLDDVYADVVPCFEALREQGVFVGVAGNQPPFAHLELQALNLPANAVETSATLGIGKPKQEFFRRIMTLIPDLRPDQVAYVGDRIDNDVLPSRLFGMHAIHLRRGPWGFICPAQDVDNVVTIDSLLEILPLLRSDRACN